MRDSKTVQCLADSRKALDESYDLIRHANKSIDPAFEMPNPKRPRDRNQLAKMAADPMFGADGGLVLEA
jgi:hypothetical protein